jgi:hypothetical protein
MKKAFHRLACLVNKGIKRRETSNDSLTQHNTQPYPGSYPGPGALMIFPFQPVTCYLSRPTLLLSIPRTLRLVRENDQSRSGNRQSSYELRLFEVQSRGACFNVTRGHILIARTAHDSVTLYPQAASVTADHMASVDLVLDHLIQKLCHLIHGSPGTRRGASARDSCRVDRRLSGRPVVVSRSFRFHVSWKKGSGVF